MKEICKTLEEAKEKWKEIPLGKCENIIGQKKNHITILYRTDNPKRPAYFVGQCDCNEKNYIKIRGNHWKDGSIKSCGCEMHGNIVGEKFGRLTILYIAKEKTKDGRGLCMCECECECGTKKLISISDIKSGHTKSCGCLREEKETNLIEGQKFGYWTVMYLCNQLNNSEKRYHCKCQCGTERDVKASSLISGTSQSCGCLKMSHGELKIKTLLEENKIPFIREYSILNFDPNYNRKFRFDFYVKNQYVIEFDGIQHFLDMSKKQYFKHGIEEIQINDKQKNQFCKNNNIPLIRIPYVHLKDLCIKDLMLETSKFIVE